MESADNNESKLPYEGAGFFLTHQNTVILGNRIKKPEDIAKDPTQEVEYFGGKPEPSDGNDPLNTAFSELVEEIGSNVLNDDWRERVKVIHIYQPFSKKWIWCCQLELTEQEFARLVEADRNLSNWDEADAKDCSKITNRTAPARKAISKIVQTPLSEFQEYIRRFTATDKTTNRMADAKLYRNQKPWIKVTRLSDNKDVDEFPLRAFNTVLFEDKF